MSVYDDIMEGLNETLAIVKGETKGRTRKMSIKPVRNMSPEEIKAIRETLGMSQRLFAELLGVSKKTVEAWEAGRNKPKGPTIRILALIENDPALAQKMNMQIV